MKILKNTIRPISMRKNFLPHTEGSCLITSGKTQVLCVATVEPESPFHAKEKGHGWVHAEYAMLPRSGDKRTSRSKAATGGRSQEISRLIGRALRAAIDLKKLSPYSVIIDCDVICADGGTRTASVNGAMVALAQALKKLWDQKKIKEWPVKQFVGAISVGVIKNQLALDMDYSLDKDAETDLNVVITETGHLIEVQGTAEGKSFSLKDLNQMIRSSQGAIKSIIAKQKKVLGVLPR